jgi:hypothetical protein
VYTVLSLNRACLRTAATEASNAVMRVFVEPRCFNSWLLYPSSLVRAERNCVCGSEAERHSKKKMKVRKENPK